MVAQKVTIEPVTRIEGHAKVRACLANHLRKAAPPCPHYFGAGIVVDVGTIGLVVHHVHLRAQKLHAIDVQRLPLGVLLAHENFALQPKQSSDRRCRDPVLSGSRFGNDFLYLCFNFGFA